MGGRRAHDRPALAAASADRHGPPDDRVRKRATRHPRAGPWRAGGRARGSARLSIVLARHGTNVRLSVELIGYQPRAAHIWPVPWIYWLQTQLHAYVGRRFVRRFARAWRRAS